MRAHSTNELRDVVNLLAPDGVTVLASNIRAGIEDLTGRRLEQAQLVAAETSHMIIVRTGDAAAINAQGYVQDGVGTLYIIDYIRDPRQPRARMWTEIYCHVERTTS